MSFIMKRMPEKIRNVQGHEATVDYKNWLTGGPFFDPGFYGTDRGNRDIQRGNYNWV